MTIAFQTDSYRLVYIRIPSYLYMPYAALRSHLIISLIHLHSIEKIEFMNAQE